MPKHKRESLIYTVMMCFVMVLWMSAYIYAMCFDWFVVSGPAKAFAFRFLVKPDSSVLQKAIAVSGCMVIPMVIIMSFYGGVEACIKSGEWGSLLLIWLTNIPKNSGGNRTFKSKYLNVSNIP